MQKNYGGVIFSDHALERLRFRGIAQGDAWAVWKKPDSSKYSKSNGVYVYSRVFGTKTVFVAAKRNEKGEWIILSVWDKYRKSTIGSKKGIFKLISEFFGFS